MQKVLTEEERDVQRFAVLYHQFATAIEKAAVAETNDLKHSHNLRADQLSNDLLSLQLRLGVELTPNNLLLERAQRNAARTHLSH